MSQLAMAILSEAEIESLHAQTLRVFEEVGVRVGHDEARAKLAAAGAKVNDQAEQVRIPHELFDELLTQAPAVTRQREFNGREHKVGSGERVCHSLVLDPFIVDYRDGRRPPTLEDVRRHTIIGQSLDRVAGLMRMQQPVSDVPEPDCYLKTMEEFMCHHSKHVTIMPSDMENCRIWLDLIDIVADAYGINSDSVATVATAVTSPLQLHHVNIELIKAACEKGFPIMPTVCPMAGTTSPYSLAGTALLANVEVLLPLLVTQVIKPGHPYIYMAGPSVTEMRSGHDLYYKAEKMKFKSILCQMGKYYNLPVGGETGGTMTHRPDVQNGAEGMAYILASVLGRQHLMYGLGSLGNANGMSAEQIIMQCGLLDMAEYLAADVDASEYKLAFDAIRRVGPGGNYLMDELTMDLLREGEFFESEHFDMTGGYQDRAMGMYELAHAKAETLVADYRPAVPENVQEAVKGYFREKYQNQALATL